MKRQVLCDSASPVGVTRWRDDGSGAGQWTNAGEYGKGDNALAPTYVRADERGRIKEKNTVSTLN